VRRMPFHLSVLDIYDLRRFMGNSRFLRDYSRDVPLLENVYYKYGNAFLFSDHECFQLPKGVSRYPACGAVFEEESSGHGEYALQFLLVLHFVDFSHMSLPFPGKLFVSLPAVIFRILVEMHQSKKFLTFESFLM